MAGIHGSPPLAESLHHLCRQSDRKSPPKEKSPPLAVLNTFEAAKDHFQHYKPTFGSSASPGSYKPTFGRWKPTFGRYSWKPTSGSIFAPSLQTVRQEKPTFGSPEYLRGCKDGSPPLAVSLHRWKPTKGEKANISLLSLPLAVRQGKAHLPKMEAHLWPNKGL